ncbi:NHLP-related RiPP peptide [Dokdonella sp.]|uniref:NHLP-related RiPP peptide n=1 Tax=Dokdonella sp. TaxID=2291710 RepID=UPI00262F4FC0|nr:NHLP-related RiPP peptide [Dokdonella sp.]
MSSDAVLTIDQCRKLMHELATNDGFRQRFQDKPAAALVELGVPFHVVVNLKASCLVPNDHLSSKEVFQDAHQRLNDEAAQRYASMMIPNAKIGTTK